MHSQKCEPGSATHGQWAVNVAQGHVLPTNLHFPCLVQLPPQPQPLSWLVMLQTCSSSFIFKHRVKTLWGRRDSTVTSLKASLTTRIQRGMGHTANFRGQASCGVEERGYIWIAPWRMGRSVVWHKWGQEKQSKKEMDMGTRRPGSWHLVLEEYPLMGQQVLRGNSARSLTHMTCSNKMNFQSVSKMQTLQPSHWFICPSLHFLKPTFILSNSSK